MSKHTRAPWRTQGWVPTWAYIPVHDAAHNLVASLYPHAGHGYTREQVEANARLIAAAPDLLAALELIASFGGKTLIGDGRYDEGAAHAFAQAADVASAALAKAVTEPRTPPTTTEDQ
jgi:hypothetical protein